MKIDAFISNKIRLFAILKFVIFFPIYLPNESRKKQTTSTLVQTIGDLVDRMKDFSFRVIMFVYVESFNVVNLAKS